MQYISISGPVASGKTTLLRMILSRIGDRSKAHEECPEDNSFLRAACSDPRRWSFHSQAAFLSLYFSCPDWQYPDCDFYFFDRCFEENLILAKHRFLNGDLSRSEYQVLESLTKGIRDLMPPIDKYIYLQCTIPLLVSRYRMRGRDYEASLDEQYAKIQKELYDQWILTFPKDKVLYIREDVELDMERVISFVES